MLTAFDDYPIHQAPVPVAHAATGDRNFYDRYFFNGYTQDGSLFFAAAMGLYPNRGVLDASFSVVCDGVQTSLHASRIAPVERGETSCGPIQVEVLEPLRRLRVVVRDERVSADLTFEARSGPIEEPRATSHKGVRLVLDWTRMTQFGRWRGWIEIAGGRVDVLEELGSRDRSWGVRPTGGPEEGPPSETAQLFWLWAPLHLGDRCLHFDVLEYADGRRWHEFGIIWPDAGEPTHMRAADHEIVWAPGTRRARHARLTFRSPGAPPIEATLEPLVTFHMKGIGYLHPEWGHGMWKGECAVQSESWRPQDLDPLAPANVHVQQLCRVQLGNETGLGVLEQLVIGPHGPSGFRGLFDGAR